MNKRIKAFLLLVSLIITSLPLSFLLTFEISASETLGSVAECKIIGDKIYIRGSIKHSVLVSNRDSTIAIYKLSPWDNVDDVIATAEPLRQTSMSISFDFELPCTTIADKTSLYAVALIDPQGNTFCISSPRYPDAVTTDTSVIGFKGVKTNDTASALTSHAGSAIVDIYLDKLDNGNKSGHIFNADGDIFYFDRDVISRLDKQILSYTAMGSEVLLRFLISPTQTNLPFCSDGRIWSANKCVVVNDTSALNAIYAYTYFLMSRYDGGKYGKANGIILGRGADMPILYNYASLVSEDYDTVYARSLSLIGLAAVNAAGDDEVCLIVPVGDSLTEKGVIYAERFLSSVADYVVSHSKLTFTVMCESTHNPYHIDDSMFTADPSSDETGEDGEEIIVPETELFPQETYPTIIDDEMTDVTDVTTPEDIQIQDYTTDYQTEPEVPFETSSQPESNFYGEISGTLEETSAPEKPKPEINTKADGFYCTDTINMFTDTLTKLKKKYSSLNKGFAWCWYPDENTLEGALGVCYSYNYMKLASEGADFFAVAFEEAAYDRFASISHLFKYIDTSKNIKETEYSRKVFEIKDWSDIIPGHASSTGVYNVLIESELQANVADYIGNLAYMDYTDTHNVGGWYEGIHCNSIIHQTDSGVGFLEADLGLSGSDSNRAEIGYMFKTPEPLLMGDALTFDVQCGESNGALYEIAVYINCENSTIVSNAVIAGGARLLLSVDVSEINNVSAVKSIRISLTRITGEGDCKLKLYSMTLNSGTLNDEELSKDFNSIRDYLRLETNSDGTNKRRQVFITVILLSSVALFSILFALANDRRLIKNRDTDIQNKRKNRGKTI
ncbi:MAG: hypothetical protein IKL40_00530 [Clostridia bacterium]|nr:hypothetical protein [Clostridia bacterium]